ncbi:MAG: cob(I)yrinic acid a,c-diamide adenosyltransferase [Veillonellaceae bacterium]|nr:cob(I)yrinic acid a,c-diamide adenosyltransferase [Veillonellaceae bacterium]
MAKIYTKTGDKGSTGLYTGERVRKSSLRVEAYGNIDELQAFLGLARAAAKQAKVKDVLLKVEKELWMLMADVASIGKEATITEEMITWQEDTIDAFQGQLPELNHFIIPGDHQTAAYLHVARTITRRAERALWRVYDAKESVHDIDIKYLNRLSDLCFILARAEEEL